MKYKHILQKPLLCFPTILSMVALRRGHSLDQEEIAKELGIKVTKETTNQD